METNTKKQNGLFKRAYEKTKETLVKTKKKLAFATVGAALVLASGCGETIINNYYGPDAGMKNDSDIVQFDMQRPKQDSKTSNDSGKDSMPATDSGVDSLSSDSYVPQPDMGTDSMMPDSQSPDSYVQTDSGVPPVTYSTTIKNLIGDYLNRDLLDRDKGMTSYSLGTSETSSEANPFSDGAGGSIGQTYQNMHRVDGTQFTPFATVSLTDNSAAKTYQEQQDVWVSGNSHYSDASDDVVGRIDSLAYTLKFKGMADDFGIPVCTIPMNSVEYAGCKSSTGSLDYATETHRLQVKFLGEDWIVSEMTPPTALLGNETGVVGGGSIKLAKEAVSGILNIGDSFNVDNLKFQLDGLDSSGTTPSAILSVLDANGNIIKKDKIAEGSTKEFSVNGIIYRIHAWKVAPEYTAGAQWADMSVFSKELEFQHGASVDPNYSNNKYWTTYLGWKNKGGSATDTQPDHLRTLIIHSDNISQLSSGGAKDLQVGDYIPLLQDPVNFKLSYNGLSATSVDYSTLKAELEKATDYNISQAYGPMDSSGTRMACTIHAPYVRITSSAVGNTFTVDSVQGAGGLASASDNQFYVATSGATCNGSIGQLMKGTLFMNVSSTSDYWAYHDYAPHYLKDSVLVKFPLAGDGVSNTYVGNLSYANHKDYVNNAGDFGFVIGEEAGTGVSKTSWAGLGFGLKLDGANSTFNFDGIQGGLYWYKMDSASYMNPSGPVSPCTSAPGNCFLEEGGITDRGSKFVSMTDTLVEFKVANTLVYSKFVFTKK